MFNIQFVFTGRTVQVLKVKYFNSNKQPKTILPQPTTEEILFLYF